MLNLLLHNMYSCQLRVPGSDFETGYSPTKFLLFFGVFRPPSATAVPHLSPAFKFIPSTTSYNPSTCCVSYLQLSHLPVGHTTELNDLDFIVSRAN